MQRHEAEREIVKAMQAPDEYVLRMEYTDGSGRLTERVISPVGFIGQTHLRAMCLGREEVRTFLLERCRRVTLIEAHEVLMPVPIRELNS